MCLECFQEPLEPPTEKTRDLRDKLKIIFWIQLVLALLKLFLGFFSSIGGFNGFIEIIACFILYVGYTQLDFTNCMYYVFICIYLGLLDVCVVGGVLQNGDDLYPANKESIYKVLMTIVIISFFFYVVAGYFSFLSYREFKATNIEMGGVDSYQRMARYEDDDEEYQRPQAQAAQSNNFGNSNSYVPRNNNDVPQATSTVNQPRPNNTQTNQSNNRNQQGGFQAFAGQGVRIGGN